MGVVAWLLIGALAGYAIGWVQSANTIAIECQRLGKFYVGESVYECSTVRPRFQNDFDDDQAGSDNG